MNSFLSFPESENIVVDRKRVELHPETLVPTDVCLISKCKIDDIYDPPKSEPYNNHEEEIIKSTLYKKALRHINVFPDEYPILKLFKDKDGTLLDNLNTFKSCLNDATIMKIEDLHRRTINTAQDLEWAYNKRGESFLSNDERIEMFNNRIKA